MSETPAPTPDEVRRKLAEFIGWMAADFPDPLPDPARDLNAMAAVEAALRGRGLGHAYLAALLRHNPDPAACVDLTEDAAWSAVAAPAAVRALAAYKVIRAAGKAE